MKDRQFFKDACAKAKLRNNLESDIAEVVIKHLGTVDHHAQLRVIRAVGIFYGWLAEPDTYFMPSLAAFEMVKRLRVAAKSINDRMGTIQGRSLYDRSAAIQEVEDLEQIAKEIEAVYDNDLPRQD